MSGSEDSVGVVDDGATDEVPVAIGFLLQGANVRVFAVLRYLAVDNPLFDVGVIFL